MGDDRLWVFACHLVYTGDEARVSRTALLVMREELAQLGIVPGVGEADFRAWVAVAIAQTPIVEGVMQHIDEEGSMTEEALEQLLDDIGVHAGDYPAHEGSAFSRLPPSGIR